MGRRTNKFSKAIKHIKSTEIDDKLAMLEAAPTNNTMGYMSSGVHGEPKPDITTNAFPTLPLPDFDQDDPSENGRDTSGLFNPSGVHAEGTKILVKEPPGDTSYILGPMSAMYYTWSYPWTQIGYIRESDRKMVDLARIPGKLSDWDGVTGFNNSWWGGQLTLEQAVWFRDIKKYNNSGNDPANANYRAFYPGPPSNTPDEHGRYYCVTTGEPKNYDDTVPNPGNTEPDPLTGTADEIFALIMDKINKGKGLTEEEKQWLRDQGLGDFADGGNTAAPLMDLIGLGLSFVAAKAMFLAYGAVGPHIANAMKSVWANEWGKRTLSDAAYKKFMATGQMPPGIQGWRPFKAFTWKLLKTGPTSGASAGLAALILQFLGGSSQQNQSSGDGDQASVDDTGTLPDGTKIAGNYGDLKGWEKSILQNGLNVLSGSQYERELRRLKQMYPGFIPQASAGSNTQVAHYEPQGLILSESRKSILKNIKKPVVLPKEQKKFKVKPKLRTSNKWMGSSPKISKPVETPKEYKQIGGRNLWGKAEYNYNTTQSQERMNQVYELVGSGNVAFDYMLTDSKKLNDEQMEKFWGKNPDFYSYFYGGKKYKLVRKEQMDGDYLVFLIDDHGEKVNILQSELNEKVAEEQQKKELEEYNKMNPKEPVSVEKDYMFKKVQKRLKPQIDYKDKPAKKGYPNDPPPEMVNNRHPDFGKPPGSSYYNKLDPKSAEAMPQQDDPTIDAKVAQAKNKPKTDSAMFRRKLDDKMKKEREKLNKEEWETSDWRKELEV